ncbi:MAG TPA: hypothetical protein VMR54_08400 [Thermoanaerobaculia bacterium]|nr:hypothetical protein [Thermoanaerobaculia bacterium]
MDETLETMGFLAENGVLYCSRACAIAQGQVGGNEVDLDEYEGLFEGGTLPPATLCPVCGAEFAVEWPEHGLH